jgi:hypothetical protein
VKRIPFVLIVLCTIVLVFSLGLPEKLYGGHGDSEQAEEEGTAEMYDIKEIPCFKCHSYDRYLQDPAPGIFSHSLHSEFEYHCNQCHDFRGHREMVINTAVCKSCHDSVPELAKP